MLPVSSTCSWCAGLVKELDAHRHDYATKYLVSHGTYILVKKLAAVAASVAASTTDELESERGSQATYVPLLANYSDHFPNYRVHVHNIEKRLKLRSQASKSPSPAGFRGTKSSRAKPPNSRASNRRKWPSQMTWLSRAVFIIRWLLVDLVWSRFVGLTVKTEELSARDSVCMSAATWLAEENFGGSYDGLLSSGCHQWRWLCPVAGHSCHQWRWLCPVAGHSCHQWRWLCPVAGTLVSPVTVTLPCGRDTRVTSDGDSALWQWHSCHQWRWLCPVAGTPSRRNCTPSRRQGRPTKCSKSQKQFTSNFTPPWT